jgi:hypothetical protein
LRQQSFSLLADCLAARFPGALRELEQVVNEYEQVGYLELTARLVRGQDVLLPGAIRWTRRRINAVRAILVTLIGLMPERFMHCQPRLDSFRQALGVELVLPALREIAANHLASLPPPLGFAPHIRRTSRHKKAKQHFMGPDPPTNNQ